MKPLSSACDNALNKLALAPLVGVFYHFENPQWFDPQTISTPVHNHIWWGVVRSTLMLYEVSKSLPTFAVALAVACHHTLQSSTSRRG